MAEKNRYRFSPHCVYNLGFHIIWCPKYRRKILVNGVDDRLKELFLEKAAVLGIEIENMEVMPDHIHLFVKSKPSLAVDYVVNQLKGYTSLMIRKEFPELRLRLPTLWTRSYYVESVGHISDKTIKKYIDEQKRK